MKNTFAALVVLVSLVSLVGCHEAEVPTAAPFAALELVASSQAGHACASRGATLLAAPGTDADLAAATIACSLSDRGVPCWVAGADPTIVTPDGRVVSTQPDGRFVALCIDPQ